MSEKIKFLTADDEIYTDELLKRMIKDIFKEEYGLSISMAENGEEAVEKYKNEDPDIVLMDINMWGKNGIEATKEIIKIDSDAIIIGVSAYANEEGSKAHKMIDAGAKDLIEKPFNEGELKEILQKYIN